MTEDDRNLCSLPDTQHASRFLLVVEKRWRQLVLAMVAVAMVSVGDTGIECDGAGGGRSW